MRMKAEMEMFDILGWVKQEEKEGGEK